MKYKVQMTMNRTHKHGLPGQGRPMDLTGGGITGPSRDEDGNVGTLPPPAYPVHHGRAGGGKPPPPMVHLMKHAVPPLRIEWQAPCHI